MPGGKYVNKLTVKQQLALGLGLTLAFMVIEGVTAFMAGSLAMLGDAAHMMTDAASFGASLGAAFCAEKLPTAQMTYGMGRIEVLCALGSTLAIWLVTGMLVHEAVLRVIAYSNGTAKPVDGAMMTLIGIFGVATNLVLERVLGGEGGHGHSHAHDHCHGDDHHGVEHKAIPSHDHHEAARAEAHHSSDDGHVVASQKTGGHDHGHEHHAPAAAPAGHDHASAHEHSHGHSHGHAHQDGGDACKNEVTSSERSSLVGNKAPASHGYVAVEQHGDAPQATTRQQPRKGQLNIDAAYLHVLGDLLQSIAVVVAGVIIWIRPDWQIADPVCTLVFAVLVLFTTYELLQSTVMTLLMGAPPDIDVLALLRSLGGIQGVDNVHDLHVWALTAGHPVMSVHIHLEDLAARTVNDVLKDAHRICQAAGIDHATIQVQHKTADGCVSKKCLSIEVASTDDLVDLV